MHQEGHGITPGIFLPQMGNSNLIMMKQTNLKVGTFHKTVGLYFSENAHVLKDKVTVSDERKLERYDR